ncbi:lysine-rich coiled-coil protein 1 isoform X2 [Hyla sarda]|uniref:lysine-rich coiled-coil protein 1 isoform X2 n=1 Tax=Hyla sarda TaxID=327740 RepID=UPI0024C331EE|nr:lysine-rich coiled-coil protein 1 isoform X2 [Hyla sarda]
MDTISEHNSEVVLDEKTKKELFTDTFCRVCGAVLQFEAHRNAHYEGKRHAQKVRLYFLKQELEELTYKKKQKVDHVEFHVDKGLSLDKNKFCSLCNMVFSSPVVAQSHYIGKIHTKKLKQTTGEQTDWSLSQEENAQSETAVTESNDTLSPLTEKSNQQDTSEDLPCGDNAIDLSDPNKYCKLCCASFNKPLVAQQHYNGKKHARNEARRKMMEEMGDTGVPMDSGGEGIFVCPICNITLTSIEMYQSHMQGNKHQIKENMVANVMRTAKKSYDSFQDELADYIKVQKARGLEPKTQLRQNKDQSDSCEEEEPVPAPTHPKANPVVSYKYPPPPPPPPPPPHPMPYPAYGPHHPPHPRLAGWDKPYWPQKPMPKLPSKAIPHRKHPRSSPDSSSESSSSSDESSSSYKKEKRHKREHRSKERKHHSKSRRENGSSERKKRKTEDSDSGKDDGEREKKNEEGSADKSKHRKDKKKKEESSADKDSKKHKKTKKIVDQRTEEELLWDESILGF